MRPSIIADEDHSSSEMSVGNVKSTNEERDAVHFRFKMIRGVVVGGGKILKPLETLGDIKATQRFRAS